MAHVSDTLPKLPEDTIKDLVENSGLTIKDAKTLVALDDGDRLEYFDEVRLSCHEQGVGLKDGSQQFDRTVANW